MPVGRLSWFDPSSGEGRIVASGREYPVEAADIAPRARTVGGRVHFDIERRGGVRMAVAVRPVEGTRSDRRQRRFGDLSGTGKPPDKGRPAMSRRHPEREGPGAGKPMEVARQWIRGAEQGDIETVLPLYAPHAVLHTPDGDARGRQAVRRELLDSGALTRGWQAEPHGDGDDVIVDRSSLGGHFEQTRLRIANGEIVEQWLV